jgi:hypothetical protein
MSQIASLRMVVPGPEFHGIAAPGGCHRVSGIGLVAGPKRPAELRRTS